MKRTAMVATSAIVVNLVMGLGAATAPAGEKRFAIERSPDVLRLRPLDQVAKPKEDPAPEAADPAVSPPTQADVGDAESFGKPVLYMGLGQTQAVIIQDDCSGSDPSVERCIVNQPAPGITQFHEANLATINLPAKASKTLLCFTLTPFINVSWANNTATRQTARFAAWADITIESPVLADPTLIDLNTGLPFGGSLTLSLSTWRNSHSIDPGESEVEMSTQSRGCIGGVISRRSLVENYGLSTTQANGVFKRPMTIRLASRGSVSMSQSALYFYGLRLYGD